MAIIRSLSLLLRADHSRLAKDLNVSKSMITQWAGRVDRIIRAGMAGVIAGGAFSLYRAMEMEKTLVSLTQLSGSFTLAQRQIKELRALSRQSGFSEDQFFAGGKKLLGFGVESRKLVSVMEQLGNAASATGAEIDGLALVYGQVLAKGKLQGEEVLQFAERGIALLPALQEQLGVSRDELQNMFREGKVGFGQFEDAFKSITTGTGRFAGMMKAMSMTTSAQLINLWDNIKVIGETIGNEITPVFREWLLLINEKLSNPQFLESIKKFGTGLASLVDLAMRLVSGFITLIGWISKFNGRLIAAVGVGLAFASVMHIMILNVPMIVAGIRKMTRAIIIAKAVTGGWKGALMGVVNTLIGAAAAWAGFKIFDMFGGMSGSQDDELRKTLAQIEKMQEDTKDFFKDIAGGGSGSGKMQYDPSATLGSQEAFRTIFTEASGKTVEEQQLEEQKKHNELLEKLIESFPGKGKAIAEDGGLMIVRPGMLGGG